LIFYTSATSGGEIIRSYFFFPEQDWRKDHAVDAEARPDVIEVQSNALNTQAPLKYPPQFFLVNVWKAPHQIIPPPYLIGTLPGRQTISDLYVIMQYYSKLGMQLRIYLGIYMEIFPAFGYTIESKNSCVAHLNPVLCH
jgi:hypothetical protein